MFRYKLLSPIRLLIPISSGLFIVPFIVDDFMIYYTFPLCYFFGAYFFFLNFPRIAEVLHQKPLYLEDLAIAQGGMLDRKFQGWYSIAMNFILALLFSSFAEYVIIQGIRKKPIVEIMAIVGGNISLYMKTQNVVGKFLIMMCHCMKEEEIIKRKLSDSGSPPSDIQMTKLECKEFKL